jgi:hypothetical protein
MISKGGARKEVTENCQNLAPAPYHHISKLEGTTWQISYQECNEAQQRKCGAELMVECRAYRRGGLSRNAT